MPPVNLQILLNREVLTILQNLFVVQENRIANIWNCRKFIPCILRLTFLVHRVQSIGSTQFGGETVFYFETAVVLSQSTNSARQFVKDANFLDSKRIHSALILLLKPSFGWLCLEYRNLYGGLRSYRNRWQRRLAYPTTFFLATFRKLKKHFHPISHGFAE